MHRGSRGLVAERGCRVRRVGYFRFARRRASRLFGFSSVRRGGAAARAGVPRAPGGVVAYTSRTRGGGRCELRPRRARGPIGSRFANKGHRSNIGADGCLSGPPHRGPGGSARIARFERESFGRRAIRTMKTLRVIARSGLALSAEPEA